MIRNVTLYPWYIALFGFTAWLPIFFLFFNEHVTLEQVLLLESIYYASTVLLEVPSGYFSDVVGRRPTLLISAAAMCLGYTLFLTGSGFWIFAAAQFCLAIGFSFKSGTDTSFHYDSLVAAGEAEAYGAREAVATRNGFISGALATFLGGAIGLVTLRWAYALSLLGALGALLLAFRFKEPPEHDDGEEKQSQIAPPQAPAKRTGHVVTTGASANFLQQLRLCIGYARQPALAWLLGFYVLMTILDHVPYEFYQPYINLLAEGNGDSFFLAGQTPLIAGIVMGLSRLTGAWAAGRSIWIRDRFGLGQTLLAATAIQTGLIGTMGLFLHPLVVPLILLRSVPHAIYMAPLYAAISPLVPRTQRATYLSLQSLCGRFAFSLTLFLLSTSAGSAINVDWQTLGWMLRSAALVGIVGFCALLIMRRMVRNT